MKNDCHRCAGPGRKICSTASVPLMFHDSTWSTTCTCAHFVLAHHKLAGYCFDMAADVVPRAHGLLVLPMLQTTDGCSLQGCLCNPYSSMAGSKQCALSCLQDPAICVCWRSCSAQAPPHLVAVLVQRVARLTDHVDERLPGQCKRGLQHPLTLHGSHGTSSHMLPLLQPSAVHDSSPTKSTSAPSSFRPSRFKLSSSTDGCTRNGTCAAGDSSPDLSGSNAGPNSACEAVCFHLLAAAGFACTGSGLHNRGQKQEYELSSWLCNL